MKKMGTVVLFVMFSCFAGASQAELTAHYDFNETDGEAVLNDKVGGANGKATDVSFVPCDITPRTSGQAGSFNGTSSFVSFGSYSHPAAFDLGTEDFTICGWFRTSLNLQQSNITVFRTMDRVRDSGWSIEIGRADRSYRGKLFFTVGGEDFADAQVMSDVRVDDDLWHFVVVVNKDGTLWMYVDNILQVDNGTMVPGVSATAAPNVESYFGRNGFVYCAGQLDEWRIYDSALSENELTRLWAFGEK